MIFLHTGTKLTGMYPSAHKIVKDLTWLESNVGNMNAIEVLVRLKSQSQSSASDTLRMLSTVQAMETSLERLPRISGVQSAIDFLPEIPQGSSVRETMRRALIAKTILERNTTDLAHWIQVEREWTVWRLSARASVFGDSNSSEFDEIRSVLREERERHASIEMDFELTGITPLVYSTQEVMGTDLLSSLSTAFLLITLVLIWQTKSWKHGLLYMIPNAMPILWVLGVMGWLSTPIDMGGVLCTTIALGIAIDETLHLLTYFRDTRQRLNATSALEVTVANCFGAVTTTTAISCAAMMPFLFSDFVPTQQFALLIILMLTLAWLGDAVVLPALLIGGSEYATEE